MALYQLTASRTLSEPVATVVAENLVTMGILPDPFSSVTSGGYYHTFGFPWTKADGTSGDTVENLKGYILLESRTLTKPES